ncbi:MAG: methionine--tRNA ligase [Candidatus Falkowbacteria bacterium]|nr:methionine--tRNA ligase [Candidatus Falkowbacteria bacterium]
MSIAKKKFYITTPIYYVNAKPHIGHTYTTIAADVLARYHRMIGDKTFFATGTDEHGAKIAEKAAELGKNPEELVDEVAAQFQQAWEELNISNDRFIRTTEKNHIKAVQNALQFMYDKGDIYLGKYEGLYCQGCEQFLNEKDLVGGKCPDHQTEPEKMSEETYMFKMSKYADQLLKLIEKEELKIRPLEKKNEIISFYKNEGLNDVSFSRKNVKWGISLPWDATHTAYVWSDAFLNYLTILDWQGPEQDQGKAKEFWPADVQLMGKDILRVHATIWPAMLLSLGLPVQKEIFVHGFFVFDGQKVSKSLGNVIAPEDLVKKYGADVTRYLLMSSTVFGNDSDFSLSKFDEKYNADLANGLGNLIARVTNLLETNKIMIKPVASKKREIKEKYDEQMESLAIDEALKTIWSVLRKCDEVITAKQPWKLSDAEAIKNILEPIVQDLLFCADLLAPIMPTTSEKIKSIFTAVEIKKGESLFPRLNIYVIPACLPSGRRKRESRFFKIFLDPGSRPGMTK